MGENNFKAKNWGEEREVKGEGCGVGGGRRREGGGEGVQTDWRQTSSFSAREHKDRERQTAA